MESSTYFSLVDRFTSKHLLNLSELLSARSLRFLVSTGLGGGGGLGLSTCIGLSARMTGGLGGGGGVGSLTGSGVGEGGGGGVGDFGGGGGVGDFGGGGGVGGRGGGGGGGGGEGALGGEASFTGVGGFSSTSSTATFMATKLMILVTNFFSGGPLEDSLVVVFNAGELADLLYLTSLDGSVPFAFFSSGFLTDGLRCSGSSVFFTLLSLRVNLECCLQVPRLQVHGSSYTIRLFM